MSVTLDAKDIRILRAIAIEETTSTDRIHEVTDIPKSTVHYRLTNMREAGVFKNDLYEIDYQTAGLEIVLISEVWAEYGKGYHTVVGDKLAEVEGVNNVYFTMGETDFIVIARLPSRDHVESLITNFESIPEIQRTSSKFVITTIKDTESATVLRDYSEETLFAAHGIDPANSE